MLLENIILGGNTFKIRHWYEISSERKKQDQVWEEWKSNHHTLLILGALSFSPSPAGFPIHQRHILFENLPSSLCRQLPLYPVLLYYPSQKKELKLQFSKIHLKTAELSHILKHLKSTSSIICNQWFTDSLSSLYWLCSSVRRFRRLVRSDLFWVCLNTATAIFFRPAITS